MNFKDTAHQRIWNVMQYLRDQQAIANEDEFVVNLDSLAIEKISRQDFLGVVEMLKKEEIIFVEDVAPFFGDKNQLNIMTSTFLLNSYIQRFEQVYGEKEQPLILKISEGQLYFDPLTGIGYLNGNEFRLKRGTNNYKVLTALYNKVGQPFSVEEVASMIGRTRKRAYLLNHVVDKLRTATGLTKNELVQNAGTITLLVQKIRSSKEMIINKG